MGGGKKFEEWFIGELLRRYKLSALKLYLSERISYLWELSMELYFESPPPPETDTDTAEEAVDIGLETVL